MGTLQCADAVFLFWSFALAVFLPGDRYCISMNQSQSINFKIEFLSLLLLYWQGLVRGFLCFFPECPNGETHE